MCLLFCDFIMKKFRIIWYLILPILLSVTITLISTNIVLRLPETYLYHFNDSQVVSGIGVDITESSFAKEIAGYLSSVKNDEFQVFEENGSFKDPVFDKEESEFMLRAKKILALSLFAGLAALAFTVWDYIYLVKSGKRKALKHFGYGAIIMSAGMVIAEIIIVHMSSFRAFLLNHVIAVKLADDSALAMLIFSPFENTFSIFLAVTAIAMILLSLYIHSRVTKENRMFY